MSASPEGVHRQPNPDVGSSGSAEGSRWMMWLAVAVIVLNVPLALWFFFMLAVFDCHGGYECPF
ncbi:hypothetical protein LRS13_22050 [Svornostia abyssi]|uniref:Uncharacterized protein n=1 Tax=Svornostia abyssi TaxID=2898438 RepID=A0ABY5PFY4_9ACTN|nr:hypothetical protein LRS13_22050 [Parviterribacteraceae bacterium J379]